LFPGGQPVKAGDQLYLITCLDKSAIGDVDFITPSPVALALNIAIANAKTAVTVRASLSPEGSTQPGCSPSIAANQIPELYRFFECCMVAATFSYQALESFANQLVAEGLAGTMRLERRDGPVDWTADQIERRCSTEEKLTNILPVLTSKASPKGTKLWQQVVALKEVRDATIHLKSQNQYVHGRPDDQTLYFQLLNSAPEDFPQWAIAMIRHFQGGGDGWLAGAEAQL
jgi:hypothetical protein